MEVISFPDFKEEVYKEILPNGLTVFYLPKKSFQKTYVSLTANIGSINLEGDNETYPAGIAHFLEHKMFDYKGVDASDIFASFGASVNAYTSFDKTCYYFTTTEHQAETVELLLDMTQSLEITVKSVEKEKGIIVEEIKMYQDMPNAEIFFQTMHNLFKTHPLSNDIAGSVESVTSITLDNLKSCFNKYYHPSNTVLMIAGDIKVDEIHEVVMNNQQNKEFSINSPKINSIPYEHEIRNKVKILEEEVSMNKLLIGFKQSPEIYDSKYEKYRLSMMIYLECLFSNSTETYEELRNKQLINDSFGYSTYIEPNYGVILFGGSTNDYEELEKELLKALKKVISVDEFTHVKRKIYGSFVRLLNSVEAEASEYVSFYMADTNLFDVLKELSTIKYEDIVKCSEFFDLNNMTKTIMLKKND